MVFILVYINKISWPHQKNKAQQKFMFSSNFLYNLSSLLPLAKADARAL